MKLFTGNLKLPGKSEFEVRSIDSCEQNTHTQIKSSPDSLKNKLGMLSRAHAVK